MTDQCGFRAIWRAKRKDLTSELTHDILVLSVADGPRPERKRIMKAEKFSGKVEQAYGKVLPSPVSFEGEFEALESLAEVPTAEKLGDADILNVINAKRKAAARASATTAALDTAGYAKPDPNSPDVIRQNMIKLAMKLHGIDEKTATSIVDATSAAAAATK